MSKQHAASFLLQKILRFTQLQLESISFDSGFTWAILLLCNSCEASVVLGKQFPWRMIIRRLLLCRKARNFVFAVFIWRFSIIFDLGLCVLIGQSELSTLCPVPGLLTNSPGYKVGQSTPQSSLSNKFHHSDPVHSFNVKPIKMLSDPVAEAFGLIHHHPSGENFWHGWTEPHNKVENGSC